MKCAACYPREEPSSSRTVTRSPTGKTTTPRLQEPHLRIERAILDCGSTSRAKTPIQQKKNEEINIILKCLLKRSYK